MESFYHAWWKGKAMRIVQDNLRINLIFIYVSVYTQEELSKSEVDDCKIACIRYVEAKPPNFADSKSERELTIVEA